MVGLGQDPSIYSHNADDPLPLGQGERVDLGGVSMLAEVVVVLGVKTAPLLLRDGQVVSVPPAVSTGVAPDRVRNVLGLMLDYRVPGLGEAVRECEAFRVVAVRKRGGQADRHRLVAEASEVLLGVAVGCRTVVDQAADADKSPTGQLSFLVPALQANVASALMRLTVRHLAGHLLVGVTELTRGHLDLFSVADNVFSEHLGTVFVAVVLIVIVEIKEILYIPKLRLKIG